MACGADHRVMHDSAVDSMANVDERRLNIARLRLTISGSWCGHVMLFRLHLKDLPECAVHN